MGASSESSNLKGRLERVAPPTTLFTSTRERLLWIVAAAVVVAIYSTLGLTRVLADAVDRPDLVDTVFVIGFVLLIAAVVVLALGARPAGLEIGVLLILAAGLVLAASRIASPAERTHLAEYTLVGALIYSALAERARGGRAVPAPALIAVGATATIGLIDELLQLAIPTRIFDPIDILFNAIAAIFGVSLCAGVDRLIRPREAQAKSPAGTGSGS